MPGNLTFETNSANIQSQFYSVLNSVTLVFNEFKNTNITVSGHTDDVGSESYNQELSVKRARSVVDYFIGRNIDPSRMRAVGYGESAPLVSNETAAGRAQNRRVEIEITPVESA